VSIVLLRHTELCCEIDHIVGVKHDGPTEQDNLAHACFYCNRNKGNNIGSIDSTNCQLYRFFNPGTDMQTEHFRLTEGIVEPITQIGAVTVRIFRFNDTDRVLKR